MKWQHKPLNMAPFLFCFLFSCPLLSFSLKVRVVSLPSFQRMTLSPMTRVTQTAAAVRATTWTRKLSFWTSLWKGQPVLPTPTVLPKLPVPCSGLWGTPPVREPLEVLHPTPQHRLVRGVLWIWVFLSFFKKYIYRIRVFTYCIPVFFSTASSTGLIYIDPTLRRSSAISSSAAAAAAALEASNSSSYLTSASSLARAYSIVIRQISDLMSLIPKYNHLVYSQYPAAVKLTYHDAVNLQVINTIRFMKWKSSTRAVLDRLQSMRL